MPWLREFPLALDAGALTDKLRGSDRRSIGRSGEVVGDVLAARRCRGRAPARGSLARRADAAAPPATAAERDLAVEILTGFLDDDSRIERTFAMQALADLAAGDAALRSRVIPLLEHLAETGHV